MTRQMTAIFGASLSGNFLPPQLRKDKAMPSQLYLSLDMEHHLFGQSLVQRRNNEEVYRKIVIFPYISKVKEDLQLPEEQGTLLIFDSFKVQCTSAVFTLLDGHNINVALVPAN